MPRRKITKKEFKQRYKPWISFGLLTSMKQRDRLLKKYIRTKNPIRKQIAHSEYKTLRNRILELTRVGKKTSIRTILLKTILTSEKYGKESKT